MIKHEILTIIESMIDETHAAVLSTVDSSGAPHSRWITPGILEERTGVIFMISGSNLSKVDQIKGNPYVNMLFQTKSLDKVVSVEGKVNIVENPSIRSEVLECVGKHLHAFWKINSPEKEIVVLELIIEQATLSIPLRGSKLTVKFAGE
jgi:pyridoxamine 5'-phosphate oxidase